MKFEKRPLMRRLPPTGAIEAFIAAARAGSLHGASTKLNLSVSALSRRIQKLEHYFGNELFTRKGNDYLLNTRGRELFAAVEVPFETLAEAFLDKSGPRKKAIHVGVPASFATAWLIPRLAKFKAELPDISLQIDTSGSPIAKLGQTYDAAIVFAQKDGAAVEFESLRPQGAFAIAQEGFVDPLSGIRSMLSSKTLLVHGDLPDILNLWLEEMRIPKSFPIQTEAFSDGSLLVAAAQSGMGVAIILEDMLNFHTAQTGLVRPFGEYVRTPFSYALAIKPASATVQTVERFASWLRAETASELSVPIEKKKPEAR